MNNPRTAQRDAPPMTRADGDLEAFVEAFEAACAVDDNVDIADFAPDPAHGDYRTIVTELIRVDLERRSERGERPETETYRQAFADVLADKASLEAVLFEEYRLRRQAGESIAREWYREQYGVATDAWPIFPATRSRVSGVAEGVRTESLLADLGRSSDAAFPDIGVPFLGFELVGELGRGAFARVYLARQGDLANRFVALKVSTGSTLEPQRLAQLQHTNIVPVYSVHREGALQAVVMPYFGATTLADVLATVRRQQSLPVSGKELWSTLAAHADSTLKAPIAGSAVAIGSSTTTMSATTIASTSAIASRLPAALEAMERLSYLDVAVWIAARVGDGLAHAHERGILHRDLKPANILITDDGQPMILDFNLSGDVAPVASDHSSIGGTLPYMSPEHLDALSTGGAVDVRSDIFALGVILFELLTGEHPFPIRRGSLGEIAAQMAADRRAAAPSPRRMNPRVSPAVDAIVRRALASNPAHRYATAAQMQEDLDRHLENLPLLHAPDRSPMERLRKWARRHPRMTSATSVTLLAAAVLVGGAMAWAYREQHFASVEALNTRDGLLEQLAAVRIPLSALDVDAHTLAQSIKDARRTLAEAHALDDKSWRESAVYRGLDNAQRQPLERRLGEALFLLARAVERQTPPSDKQRAESLRLATLATGMYGSAPPRAVLAYQADLLLSSGRTDEADAVRKRAAEISADDPLDRYLLAIEHAAASEYDDATKMLTEVRRELPQDVAVWFTLGNTLAAAGKYHDAEGCFTTAAALEGSSPWPWFYRGAIRLTLKEFAGAESDFDAALDRSNDWPVALANRGLARLSQGKRDGALADLNRATELGCSQTRLYFVRAKLRQQMGDAAGAAADRQTGLTRRPTDEKSWVARALAHLPEEPAAALADLQEAARLYPRSPLVHQNLAHVLAEHLHQTEQAISPLDTLLAAEPKSADARAGRGVLLARLGRRDAAMADGQQAWEEKPQGETAYKQACILAILAGNGGANDKVEAKSDSEDAAAAVRWLAEAVRLDLRYVEQARQDADLVALRQRRDYRDVLSAGELLSRSARRATGGIERSDGQP